MTNNAIVVSKEIAGRTLSLESGRMAKQANGSVIVRYGDTMVLASACMSNSPREGIDFFPLTIDYRENRAAAGKFPGGFFKREGRPSEKETLTSRCIDRPIRPCFPDGFKNEVQVLLSVHSYDMENNPDVLGMIAAFAALEISDIPFDASLAAVRIGKVDGELVVNPTAQQMEETTMNLVIAGTSETIQMVEGAAKEESEESMLEAFDLALVNLKEISELISELREKCGKEKAEYTSPEVNEELKNKISDLALDRVKASNSILDKHERNQERAEIFEDVKSTVITELNDALKESIKSGQIEATDFDAIMAEKSNIKKTEAETKSLFKDLVKNVMRNCILDEGIRIDGRKPDEIRKITCEIGVLPRTHGSALFTRGETQALVSATLGTLSDEQKIDGLCEEYYKKFMLHYNFPPYSVGEVRPMRGPGRREIGHGNLAERSLKIAMPEGDDYPYTVRIVSDILESNGSSSMASVCGGSLALMDAGVPVKATVAGIAMGLIMEDGKYAVLSDILGDEDHLGDMDFKVTGTRNGINAFQMDLKITGVTRDIMAQAMEQACKGRIHIMDIMEEAIAKPRDEMSPFAPRIHVMMVPVEKIRDIIGPGGKMIRQITAETGAKIDIEDDGKVIIASSDENAGKKATEWIEYLTEEVEVGKIYKGKVTRLVNFGAFVEILPGQEGLVHISALAPGRVEYVDDVLDEGDEVEVKVIEIDDFGRTNLSKVEADRDLGRVPPQTEEEKKAAKERESRGGGRSSGGGRGGDRGGRSGGGGRGGDRGGRSGGGGRGGDRGGRR